MTETFDDLVRSPMPTKACHWVEREDGGRDLVDCATGLVWQELDFKEWRAAVRALGRQARESRDLMVISTLLNMGYTLEEARAMAKAPP